MYTNLKSRDEQLIPSRVLETAFAERLHGFTDSEFLTCDCSKAVGATGLPYYMPVCLYALNNPVISDYLLENDGESHLFDFEGGITHITESGEKPLPEEVKKALLAIFDRLDKSAGDIDE